MDELKLAKRAKKGDRSAFIALMNLYKEDLYRTAFAYLKNEADALDAIQETTVRSYKNIHKVRNPQYMKTWMIKILMNYCQDQLKIRNRFVPTEDVSMYASTNDTYLIEIEEALLSLSIQEQQLMHMKYFQDLKNKEIAQIEKIPEGTVKSRIHTTLGKLRKFLREREEESDV